MHRPVKATHILSIMTYKRCSELDDRNGRLKDCSNRLISASRGTSGSVAGCQCATLGMAASSASTRSPLARPEPQIAAQSPGNHVYRAHAPPVHVLHDEAAHTGRAQPGRHKWYRAELVGQEKTANDRDTGGGDNGTEVGVDLGAPFRADPIRYSTEDHRGPQRPLALGVGCLDVAAAAGSIRLTSGIRRIA
jgi:hypothetical protein